MCARHGICDTFHNVRTLLALPRQREPCLLRHLKWPSRSWQCHLKGVVAAPIDASVETSRGKAEALVSFHQKHAAVSQRSYCSDKLSSTSSTEFAQENSVKTMR